MLLIHSGRARTRLLETKVTRMHQQWQVVVNSYILLVPSEEKLVDDKQSLTCGALGLPSVLRAILKFPSLNRHCFATTELWHWQKG